MTIIATLAGIKDGQFLLLSYILAKREVNDDVVLTIGKAHGNILQIDAGIISAFHGEITSERKWFKRRLYYKDTSKNGTYYLPPGVLLQTGKYIKLHNQKVEIKSGSTLCFFSDMAHRKEQGMAVLVELK